MIRVAFIIPEELSPSKNKKTSWLGGLNYYKNVVSAVYKLPDRKIEIVVFVNTDASDEFVEQFSDATIIRSSMVNFIHDGTMKFKKPLKKTWLHLLSKLNTVEFLLEKLFLKHQIIVYCYGDPLKSKMIKSICWVADFQQIHHPEFFGSEEELKERNKHVNLLIEKSDALILSSETALQDLIIYNKKLAHKARVLKFIPAIDLKIKLRPIAELREKYQIHSEYFFMPNQFWKHKNHQIVVKAVDQTVNKQKQSIVVLASGSLTDYRNMPYIENLIQEIETLHLTQNLKLLGVIPYIDVLSLIHFSIALINPSFSEGWSSTVEEAKQLKSPLILSDIPIHREQTVGIKNATLFNPNNHLELANILLNYNNTKSGSETFDYKEEFEAKQLKFGNDYQNIVLEVLTKS